MPSSVDDGRPPPPMLGLSGLWNLSDPLLRRLRFEDPHGKPVENLARALDGKKVIVFYVASTYGESALRDLHRDLIDLAIRQAKSCIVLYISTDSSSQQLESATQNKPFWRLTFSDNSDFAPMASSEEEAVSRQAGVEDVARDEEFISGEEYDVGVGRFRKGEEEDLDFYVRPYSRAAVCKYLNALGTPSLSVYHIPSHSFVSSHTRQSFFRPKQIEENFRLWKNGGTPGWGLYDLWLGSRIPLLILLATFIYSVYVSNKAGADTPLTPLIKYAQTLMGSKVVLEDAAALESHKI